uniref:Uncharacterized protein n=1 Tax=Solanum tuberosum TaxID=4113 RepID=M1A6L3_SOLTU
MVVALVLVEDGCRGGVKFWGICGRQEGENMNYVLYALLCYVGMYGRRKEEEDGVIREEMLVFFCVARTLQKCQRVRVGFAKSSVVLENPRRVRHQKWRVRATTIF